MLTTDEQCRLRELRRAYDELISGKAVASVEYAGERTMFNRVDPTSMARLADKITELEALERAPAHRPRRAAVRFRL